VGFRLRITSPAGVTWADTHLMPVSRLQLAAMGANQSDLALTIGYTTASGALSNVQLAMVPFPAAAGGAEGFVKKLASLAVASGDMQKDIERTIEACKGLVNADVKPAEIESLTERATVLVRLFWRVLEMIETKSNAGVPAEYNGYKIELIA
jgi:hypothetical protein